MSIAQDLLLVALDPESGKVRLSSMSADVALGGAALTDLVVRGRLELVGEGRRAKVAVRDHAPVDDPDLQAAFERVHQRGHQAPKTIVGRLGRKQRRIVVDTLRRQGTLRDREATVLGFRVERHELVDVARRDALVSGVRQVLLQGQPADDVTGPLVALLHATDQLRLVVERDELRAAKERAKVVVEGDWASEGVRRAVQEAQAALMVAVTAGAAGAASSGS